LAPHIETFEQHLFQSQMHKNNNKELLMNSSNTKRIGEHAKKHSQIVNNKFMPPKLQSVRQNVTFTPGGLIDHSDLPVDQ